MTALIVAADSSSGRLVAAGLTLLAALVLVAIVHRLMRGRVHKLPDALGGAELSPMLDTRLRFLRRAVEAAIIVVGFALALALANAIAGMVLAVTQPLRIGDLVTFEDETGTVEDVTLTYTWLRTGSDARLIIPNERLAAGVLRNDSIRSPTVALEVSAWLAPDADETAALNAVKELEETRSARIAEVTDTGLRLQVAGPPVPPAERIAREGELRAEVLRALREAGCRGARDEP